MQMTAVAWLIWRLEHNAFLLGLVGFTGRIPVFVMAPFAGVLIDRMNKHRLIIITQIFAMLQALILAGLMYSGQIRIWQIIILSLILGFVNAIDMPSRQSFLVHMIGRKEDLTNAIALNSILVNSARLIGPSVAGFLIAGFGEQLCFLLNGLSYIAVIACLLMMRVKPFMSKEKKSDFFEKFREGLHYAWDFKPIRSMLLLLFLVSLFGASYAQLLPVFAGKILNGDARTQGFLISAAAVGALCGGIYLAWRPSVHGLGKILAISPAVFGVGLIGLGLSKLLWLTILIMPVIGIGMMVQMASTNTLIQTIVDDDKRGRVMSFYSMAFMGTVPIGSLFAGTIAQFSGAPFMVIFGGCCCIAGSLAFSRQVPSLQKITTHTDIRQEMVPES